MANNKQDKIPNVPNKRAQRQTRLNDAERAALGPKGSVPPLRFSGFTDDWHRCHLASYGNIITGNTPSTNQSENYEDEGYLWASPSDLGFEKYIYDTKTHLSKTGFQTTRRLPARSILVTCIGSTIGKMGMAYQEMSTNQQINALIVDSRFDTDFVYYCIQSRFPKYLSAIAIQAVPILSKSSFADLESMYPSLEEQIKIGKLLSLLDDRIATQRKIIEDLEQLKFAIYHRVFSTIKGRTVALRSVANIVKGKQLNGTELSDNGDYYVMNGGLAPSGYYQEYNTPANTISISEGGNSCGYVQFNYKPFWSGGHCYTLHLLNEGVNLQFLYHFLKYREKDIMSLRIGSGLPNIQKKDLGNFSILLPAINEQKKVACLFNAIQKKIDVDTKLLNLLLVQKQYILQQMFI